MRCPPRCGLSSTPTTTTTTTTPRSSGSIRILNGITGRLVVAAVWVWVGLLRWMVGGSSSSSSSSSNIAPTAFSAGSGRRRMPHPVGGSSRPVPQRPFQQQSHPRRLGRRRPNSGGTAAFAIAAANRVVPFATTITQTTMSHRATVMDDDTTNDDTDFSDPVPPYYAHHPRKKAARTNKYQQFSKVQSSALDPQELLLRDATRQNSQLAAAERLSGWPKPNQAAAKANLAGFAAATDDTPPRPATVADFPDTKGIDPYDPQTFGYIALGTIVAAHGVHGWLKVRSLPGMSNRHWHTCLSRIRNSSTFNKDNTNSAANALALCHVKAAGKRAPRPWEMLQGKHCHGDEYLIQLAGIRTRDQAQTMRGASLYLRQEQQRIDPNDNENDNNNNNNSSNTKAPDEYLVADLVGLNVFLYQQPQPNDAESAKDNNDNDTPSEQYVGIVGGVAFAEDFCSIPGLGHDYIEVILPRGVGGVRTFWRDEMVLIPLVPQLVPIVNVDAGVIYIDPPSGLLDLSYVREDKTRIKGLLPPAADKQADSMETTA